jgi:hypothetical protein
MYETATNQLVPLPTVPNGGITNISLARSEKRAARVHKEEESDRGLRRGTPIPRSVPQRAEGIVTTLEPRCTRPGAA